MAISNKRFLLGGALAGLADAFYANGGMQPQAMGQFIARDDMMREKDEEDQRRRAMQQALMGAVNEMDPSHLRASVNPIMGRATPELAAGQGTRMSAARRLMANPDTMGMGFEMAMQNPERRDPWDAFKVADGRVFGIGPDGKPRVEVDKPTRDPEYTMVYHAETGKGYPLVKGSSDYKKALGSGLYTLDKPSEKNERPEYKNVYDKSGTFVGTYDTSRPDVRQKLDAGEWTFVERREDKPTQPEMTYSFHAERLGESMKTLDEILQKDPDALTSLTPGDNPLSKWLRGENAERVRSALPDIGDSLLTLATGAAYTETQFDNMWKANLPALGDSDPVLADKLGRVQKLHERAKKNAGKLGLDIPSFDLIASFYKGTNKRQGGAPTPGTVEDGYRFKGGNPADPNNWERM